MSHPALYELLCIVHHANPEIESKVHTWISQWIEQFGNQYMMTSDYTRHMIGDISKYKELEKKKCSSELGKVLVDKCDVGIKNQVLTHMNYTADQYVVFALLNQPKKNF